ncbi:MAG: hypothetical protein ACKV2O_06955 [Acidimicrobiales bacterium]
MRMSSLRRMAAAALLLFGVLAQDASHAGAAVFSAEPAPYRRLDTRFSVLGGPPRRLAAGETLTIPQMAPAGSVAVQLNITVVNPDEGGYLTAFGCGERPWASTVNFIPNEVVANAAAVPVGPNGEVCVFTTSATHLVIDYNGALLAGSGFNPVAPTRLFDTRTESQLGPAAKVGPALPIRVQATGLAGVASSAVAVSINLAATESDADGFLTAYPCGEVPLASNLNHPPAKTVPNAVVVTLDAGGGFCIFTVARTHIFADVNGWYDATSGFIPRQERMLDTRTQCGGRAGTATSSTGPPVLDPGLPGGGGSPAKTYPFSWTTDCTSLAFSFNNAAPINLEAANVVFPSPPGVCTGDYTVTIRPTGPGGAYQGVLTNTPVCPPGPAVTVGSVEVTRGAGGAFSFWVPLAAVGQSDTLMYRLDIQEVGQAKASAPAGLGGGGPQPVTIEPLFGGMRFLPMQPASIRALIVNLTVTGATAGGFAHVGECFSGTTMSTVNYGPGETRANLAIVPVTPNAFGGTKLLCVTSVKAHVVVDILGQLS